MLGSLARVQMGLENVKAQWVQWAQTASRERTMHSRTSKNEFWKRHLASFRQPASAYFVSRRSVSGKAPMLHWFFTISLTCSSLALQQTFATLSAGMNAYTFTCLNVSYCISNQSTRSVSCRSENKTRRENQVTHCTNNTHTHTHTTRLRPRPWLHASIISSNRSICAALRCRCAGRALCGSKEHAQIRRKGFSKEGSMRRHETRINNREQRASERRRKMKENAPHHAHCLLARAQAAQTARRNQSAIPP